jgi:hypothetical protein
MAKGGKRPGAGRPPGSKALDFLEKLKAKGKRDHQDEEHYINEYLDFLIDNYKEDARLMQWMGDHIFGKAAQPLTGADGGPIEIKGVKISVRD